MLSYERTPYVSAAKLCALGLNTQLVVYDTFRKARWMYWYKNVRSAKQKTRMLGMEHTKHVFERQQYDTYARAVLVQLARRVLRTACMSCFSRNLKHITGSLRAGK